tara:strand:+ start:3388 stop:3900 length:513 start_codon:yes stop_codon:yes gene_type:complete
MKSYKEYLKESKQSYKFRVKLAQELSDEQIDKIERHLGKYDVKSVSAPKKLMLQSTPYDFPTLRGYEIIVMEFETDRVASAYQIQVELSNLLGLGEGLMKVRSEHEPLEKQEQSAMETKGVDKGSESLLADGDYSETTKIDGEDYYGDKYNTKFVQELLALRKTKEKESK